MKNISDLELIERIKLENPWWEEPNRIDDAILQMPRRAYFELIFPFIQEREPRRALILMGPRRVGKTIILQQSIQQLIDDGFNPKAICYIDLQTPLYSGLTLERMVAIHREAARILNTELTVLYFDEIQYLSNWEVQLKNLVDRYKNVKFVASGSAAAALKIASNESGAGRFSDFLLPPITFYEYLDLRKAGDLISCETGDADSVIVRNEDIDAINEHFITYLNAGGYPEAIFSARIQSDPGRYIRSDIIEKVLMKDLPSLYGINDIQELNSLFNMLAYNTAGEVSLDQLSQKAGIAKNTIKRYIDYLETAFLIKIVHRIDRSAKQLSRANFFKVYLTNPSMRSALFSPLKTDSEGIGHLVETGVFSQWFHFLAPQLYYARWDSGAGEVDLVKLSTGTLKPQWSVEVKWSDSSFEDHSELKSLRKFISTHPSCAPTVLTRTVSDERQIDGVTVDFIPCALYCYLIGWNIIRMKKDTIAGVSLLETIRSSKRRT